MTPLNLLQIYTSREGQTARIMTCIADVLIQQGHSVDTHRLEANTKLELDVTRYDRVLIGGSIHYGQHEAFLADFIRDNQAGLAQVKTAFFSVNLTARKPEKNTAETNPYMVKFLAQLNWQPTLSHVFAGALLYSRYGFWDKQIIRFIMWLTKGNTDVHQDIDYTNWADVKPFAKRLCE